MDFRLTAPPANIRQSIDALWLFGLISRQHSGQKVSDVFKTILTNSNVEMEEMIQIAKQQRFSRNCKSNYFTVDHVSLVSVQRQQTPVKEERDSCRNIHASLQSEVDNVKVRY